MNNREAFDKFAFDPAEETYPLRDPHTAIKVWDKAWQASRKQLLKELSETVPFAYVTTEGLQGSIFGDSPVPLIIRPTAED